MSKCPNGHDVLDQSRFCSTCGLEVALSHEPKAPEVLDPLLQGAVTPTATQSVRKPANRRVIVGVGALLAAILGFVFVFTSQGGSSSKTVRGVFTLYDSDVIGNWDSCSGTGGYDDFGAGMDVTIRDQDGKIVANANTQSLDRDIMSDLYTNVASEMDRVFGSSTMSEGIALLVDGATNSFFTFCTVYYEAEVPLREFYEIEVGSRGSLAYSKSELEEFSFVVYSSLGN
jgi:hypothetical protein